MESKNLPKRKRLRLKNYDYSQNGYYFITICTRDKRNIFYDFVSTTNVRLNENAQIVINGIEKITEIYDGYSVDKYVIMPNHIHMILVLDKDDGRPMNAPTTTVSTVINQFKGYVSKEIGFRCWQRSFYEHIIRNDREYLEIYRYIEENPIKWETDKYYTD